MWKYIFKNKNKKCIWYTTIQKKYFFNFCQQEHIILIKTDSKDIYDVTKYLFQITVALLNFLFF